MKKFSRALSGLLLAGALCASQATARSVIAPGKAVSQARADLVIDLEIMARHPSNNADVNCGVAYEARINKVSKGAIGGAAVTFGYLDGLEVGRSYRVYLATAKNKEKLRRMLLERRWPEPQVETFLKQCAGRQWEYYFFSMDRL
ncbi:hypothetical protein [Janthinobacterium sp. J1-1]|uniref:hypothetical protein n=1 Tax=unclassified Janthinobacterium TaxID=2610881 RepID=UPI0028117359|nr:hypothetical protein [Janthinobacterium sp. J1-1]